MEGRQQLVHARFGGAEHAGSGRLGTAQRPGPPDLGEEGGLEPLVGSLEVERGREVAAIEPLEERIGRDRLPAAGPAPDGAATSLRPSG